MSELSKKIGKFDSAESLLKAYNSLESEFTKRSQKLKALSQENQQLSDQLCDTSRLDSYAKQVVQDEDFLQENILSQEKVRRKVIDEYLRQLSQRGAASVLGSGMGGSALTPPARPTSLSEAKRLADIIINS